VVRSESHKPRRLALLVGANWQSNLTVETFGAGAVREDSAAVYNDVAATRNALTKRGFSSDEILTLQGALSRRTFMSFLASAGQRTAHWQEDQVFFYLVGHGDFSGTIAAEARVGVQVAYDTRQPSLVFWDEALNALQLPPRVNLLLLPDS
jgi:hypothetical protein